MRGKPDGAAGVGDAPRHGLPDPPRRIGGEPEAAAVLESIDRRHQADVAVLDQVEERHPAVAVALGNGDDEPEVRLYHVALERLPPGRTAFALEAPEEIDLLLARQERHAANL